MFGIVNDTCLEFDGASLMLLLVLDRQFTFEGIAVGTVRYVCTGRVLRERDG